jgi:hypothetical protein
MRFMRLAFSFVVVSCATGRLSAGAGTLAAQGPELAGPCRGRAHASNAPGQIQLEGGRIVLVPPAAMREVREFGVSRTGLQPLLSMADSGAKSTLDVLFLNELPRVADRLYQARWRESVEAGDRRSVRWIRRGPVDAAGVPWLRMEYVRQLRHALMFVVPFQGRTLVVRYSWPEDDGQAEWQIQQSLAQLAVYDCPLPPGTEPPVERRADADAPVCEAPALQTRLAGDPRRAAVFDERISFVPPAGAAELDEIELARALRGDQRSARVFTGGDARVMMELVAGRPGDVETLAFAKGIETTIGRREEPGGYIAWAPRELVDVGGATALKIEFTRHRGSRADHRIIYVAPFQGRLLWAEFQGAPAARETLARSAATLEVHDCGLVRPLWTWLDSAAVTGTASRLQAPGLPQHMKPIFRVTFDTTGVLHAVEPVYGQIPSAYADSVAAVLRAAAKPQPPSRRPMTFLVRVEGGPTPRVDEPDVVYRAARPRDPVVLGGALGALARSLRPEDRRQPPSGFLVWMRVGADGKVDRESVRLLRTSGLQRVDDGIVSIARKTEFRPAEVDGHAASDWVVITMTLSTLY